VGLIAFWQAGLIFTADDARVSSGGNAVALQSADTSVQTAPVSGRNVGLEEGQVAPDFVFSAFDGKRLHLSDLRGRPVLVNFWATWCIPCRAEMPDLDAAQRLYAPQQFAIIGVNNGEKYKPAQAFIEKLGVHFTEFAYDPDSSVAKRYSVAGMPTSYFIDARGVITKVVAGSLTPTLLKSGVESAIAGYQ